MICVPGAHVLDAAESALAAGVRALCVISAGFAEVGAEGVERQDALLALVRAHGARLVGPELPRDRRPGRAPERDLRAAAAAAGAHRLLVPERRARARAARGGGRPRPRLLRASSRSGTRPTSRRTTCSSGGTRTTATDARAPLPRVVREPAQVRAGSRSASRRHKPILALKAGSTGAGARAASSHTAALAGSDARRRRALPPGRRAARPHARGAHRRRRAALDASRCRTAAASASLTNAGGLGILCADACDAARARAARARRRDARGAGRAAPGRGERREPGRHARLGDRGDLRGGDPAAARRSRPRRAHRPLRAAGRRRRRGGRRGDPHARRRAPDADKPVARRRAQRRRDARGAPRRPAAPSRRFRTPSRRRARSRSRPSAPSGCAGRTARFPIPTASTARPRARIVDDRAARRPTTSSSTPAARARCSTAYGIPLVRQRLAYTASRRRSRRPRELGFPAVVKTAAAGRAQDRASAASRSTCRDEVQVRLAVERIGAPRARRAVPDRRRRAARRRRAGPGLRAARRLRPRRRARRADRRRRSFAIAPLTDVDAEELVARRQGRPARRGFRGAPPADPGARSTSLHRLAPARRGLPRGRGARPQPGARASAHGCVAVDARIRLRRHTAGRSLKSW